MWEDRNWDKEKNSWQWVNRAWLYSDLYQALIIEHLSALGFFYFFIIIYFCVRSIPERRRRGVRKWIYRNVLSAARYLAANSHINQ